jgi:hypothetical protein
METYEKATASSSGFTTRRSQMAEAWLNRLCGAYALVVRRCNGVPVRGYDTMRGRW